MVNKEHIERFHRYCGTPNDDDHQFFHLSKDRCMGIKIVLKEEDLIFFGTLKLKYRPEAHYIQVGNMYVNTNFVLTAMKILRRRKYLSLGLLKMGNGIIFIVREGDNNICIAPVLPENPQDDTYDSIINMVEPASGLLMEWLCYSGVFGVKK